MKTHISGLDVLEILTHVHGVIHVEHHQDSEHFYELSISKLARDSLILEKGREIVKKI